MGVMVPVEPIRPSTFRGVLIGAAVLAVVIAIIASVASKSGWGFVIAPVIWLIAAYSMSQVYRPEPAIEEWDKIPREVRMQMVRVGHPAAWTLGKYDRDWEIQKLWRTTLNKGIIGG